VGHPLVDEFTREALEMLVERNIDADRTVGVLQHLTGERGAPEHLRCDNGPDYTPTYSSWINQVERWFAYLTDDLLRRSDHRSVQALEKDIRAWVTAWNENPKPFIWTKTADQILESLLRLLQRINGGGH
jgi:transposase